MGKSLQDQLLKAGLANKKQAVKAKKAKNNKEKLKRAGVAVEDAAETAARDAKERQIERDRELNQQRTEMAEQKAIQAQIRQIVSMNRIETSGELDFQFTDNGVIKSIMVDEQQRSALVRGALIIIKVDDRYSMLPRPAGEKIADRDSTVIVLCNDATEDESIDDAYAEFKVPDDLMW